MARATPTYSSGSVAGGSGVLATFFDAVVSSLQSITSNATTAWGTYDDLVGVHGGTRDKVFRSLGDRTLGASNEGDALIYFRWRLASNIMYFNAWQDYSDTGNDGHATRRASTLSTTSGDISFSTLTDTDAINWFMAANAHEFTLVFSQGANWHLLGCGVPRRAHIPDKYAGYARGTASATAGAGVTLSIDRDLTASIVTGQKIWIYNATPAGSALLADNTEVTTVTSVSAGPNQIVVSTLASNKDNKFVIGLDPCPTMLWVGLNTGDPVIEGVNRPDGTAASANNTQTFEVMAPTTFEGDSDPAQTNLYTGYEAGAYGAITGLRDFRGIFDTITYWSQGSQANEDRMIPNNTTSLARKVFPSLAHTGFSLAIGPGAT